MMLRLMGVLVLLAGSPAWAAQTQARLLLASDTVRPGDTVLAGLLLQMNPKWHTYWKNAGGGGLPTEIQWHLPPGFTAGEIQWPVPEKLPDGEFTTYIYEHEVLLLVPVTLSPDLKAGKFDLKASVTWIECAVQCVQGKAEVEAELNVGAGTKPSDDAARFDYWQKRLPLRGDGSGARAWWENPPAGDQRLLVVEWNSTEPASEADFFPGPSEGFEFLAATERLPSDAGKIRLRKTLKKSSGDWPKQLAGVLIQKSGTNQLAYEAVLPVEKGTLAAISPASGPTNSAGANAGSSLWENLLYAFLGGLILNVMPCVLPVISLKILGFVGEARNEPRRIRNLGLIYALGVLVSFLVLAGLVIAVKVAGRQAGWGMQFSNPQFLVILTVLVTLVALNLFGLFEVNLGSPVMNAAGTLASRHGAAGAFFNGVLATILATPCTAPFLSIALGFAFARPPAIIILFFATIALGLASPYVLLSWNPAWLKFLPKPGAWMEKFKIAMGFPMLATACWMLNLTTDHYGARAWWLGMFLVFVGLAAWVFGEFFQRGSSRRGLGLAFALALLGVGYVTVLEERLHWRSPETLDASRPAVANDPDGVPWQPWSTNAVAAARAQQRPVLVDFTASWCLTCNAVVKPALESAEVRKRLKEINAVPLLADNSKFPPAIADELARHGRAGVPLVLVYPKDPNEPVMVLPEPPPLRSPSYYAGVVLEALTRAVASR